VPAIALLIPFILIAFWLWMFNDMLNNDNIPNTGQPVFRWPPATRDHWIILFIFLNIFMAGYYYLTEYNKR
jgi:hypothetical protein